MSNPALKVEAVVMPAHKAEHARRRRAEAEWFKNRTTGFVRCMTDVTIDDGLIARKTGRKFYELKSFGQTMQWSLDKQQVLVAKEAMAKGVLINSIGDNILRFLPPLIITRQEIVKGLRVLEEVLKKI